MKVETGKQAVWQHAKECGMSEDIARIAKFFDIKDVRYYRQRKNDILTRKAA